MIQTSVNPAAAVVLSVSAFKRLAEQVAQNAVLEAHVANAIATRTIHSSAYTTHIAIFVKGAVVKCSPESPT